jgi:queuine tRNA-ribosyltransferase
LYTKDGKIHITNTEYRLDTKPVEEDCPCYTCTHYSRSYICHLFHGKEMLAGTLSSIHNIHFLVNLVKKIRQSILDGNFMEFKESFLNNYKR